MPKRRGRNASNHGRHAEETFQGIIQAAGFVENDWESHYSYSTQVKVPHPYRPGKLRSGKADCWLETPDWKIYAQVKHQRGSGTTDEKLPFAFDIGMCALASMPFDYFWMVLMGPHWASVPGLVKFMRAKAEMYSLQAKSAGHDTDFEVLVGAKEVARAVRNIK